MRSAPTPREGSGSSPGGASRSQGHSFACPDCGQRQRGGEAGAVVPCAGCGSPITVPAPKVAKIEAPQPKSAAAHVPWARVAMAAGLVAALHVGVYLILTSEARSGMREIESKHSARELADAKPPGAAPGVGTAAYGAWRAKEAAHQAAHVYGKHEAHHDLVRNGILVSFFVQTAFAAWVLARIASRVAAASRRAARRS